MLPVPVVSSLDLHLGNAKYLPDENLIPQSFWDDFKSRKNGRNEFMDFAENMFYSGVDSSDIKKLLPKEGVHKEVALNALKTVMRAGKPSDEIKIVSSAFMLSEWFSIKGD